MSASEYSFIDIAVLDDVRGRFAAGDALAILSSDLEEVIWANGPGARLFGYPDIEAIMGASTGLAVAQRRQIAATPGFPAIGSGRPLVLRLNAGATSRAIGFQASGVVLPDGEQAILLASPAAAAGARDPGEIARRAISGFTEAGYYAAFVRGSTVAAAAPGYEALGVSAETVEAMVAEAADAPDRLVKRLIPAASGRIPAGMARLSDDPPIHLLVVVDDPELYRAEDFPEEEPASPDTAPEDGFSTAADMAASEAPETPATPILEPATSTTQEAAQAGDEQPAQTGEAEQAPAHEAEQPAPAAEDRGPVDRWYFESDAPAERPRAAANDHGTAASPSAPDATAQGAAGSAADPIASTDAPADESAHAPTASADEVTSGDETSLAPETAAPAAPSIHDLPPFTRSDPPVRFAWRTDAEGRFSTVSDDFLRVIAATEDDIVGRAFAEVAASLDIDPTGDIAGLLDRRDTWSGKTVLWPIGDSGWRAPVDLAALPVYARDRRFEGFRGFGIARPADAVFMPLPRRESAPSGDLGGATGDIEGTGPQRDLTETPVPEFGPEDEALPASGSADSGFDRADAAPASDGGAASPAAPARPEARETPVIAIDEARARRYPDKIIRLAEHRGPGPERALSPGERNAFREIGDRLKEVTGPREPQAAAPEAGSADTGSGSRQARDRDDDATTAEQAVGPDLGATGWTEAGAGLPESETPDQASSTSVTTTAASADDQAIAEPEIDATPADHGDAEAIDWMAAAAPADAGSAYAEADDREASHGSEPESERAAWADDAPTMDTAFVEVEEELTELPAETVWPEETAGDAPPAEAAGFDWAPTDDVTEAQGDAAALPEEVSEAEISEAADAEAAASAFPAELAGHGPARRTGEVLAGQIFVDRSSPSAAGEEAPTPVVANGDTDAEAAARPDAIDEPNAADLHPPVETGPADQAPAPWQDASGDEPRDAASPAAETPTSEETAETPASDQSADDVREEAPAMAEQPRFAMGSAEQPVHPMVDAMIAADTDAFVPGGDAPRPDEAAVAAAGPEGPVEASAGAEEQDDRGTGGEPAGTGEARPEDLAAHYGASGLELHPDRGVDAAEATRTGETEEAAFASAEVVRLPFAADEAEQAAGDAGVGRGVLARLPLPVLVHAGDVLHFANDAFFAFTGYHSLEELDEAGGLGALFVDPQADTEDDGRPAQSARLLLSDGTTLAVHAHLQSIPWGRGKALLLALRPAETPREEAPAPAGDAETALAARVEEMRTILDTATDGVVLIANDGTIRSMNRPAEALFGQDDGDVAGKPFVSLLAVESQRAARDYLQGLSDNGVASVLNDGREVIGREAQGRFIPLFMTIGRLPGGNGYCAVLRDITPWKRAEEELTKARTIAERASSQKSEFLARVSHEIRTPLNAIIGFSELMMDEKFGPIGNDRYRDYLRDINRSGNHVLDLVNDLLDISKIEAGEQEMAYEAVSLNEVLSETVAMMQPQANRERVIIRSSFASRLPDVVADLRSIRQIGLNLLSNAVRFTQPGGQVIVSTAYEASGDVVMRVRDTGVGMSSAEIEQALKPFKQINTLRRPRMDGTGLGLPLTKAMVEANRARFVIHSSPGEGTLVEIAFPSTRVLAD